MRRFTRYSLVMMAFLWLFSGQAFAAMKMPPIKHKPFATHHIVMQISSDSPRVQTLVLNVANNLMHYYGSDKLDLEIVAFGPGLRLLLANNVNAKRIDALHSNYDIHFDACHNTLMGFAKKLGYMPKLNPNAVVVPAGAARIVELEQHGYALLKP